MKTIHCGHCKAHVPIANTLLDKSDHALATIDDVRRDPVTRKRLVTKRQVMICLVNKPMRAVATPSHGRSLNRFEWDFA